MKSYTFEVAEHEEFRTLGFKPSWYPKGDPLGGIGVAHDILEHFPKDDGSAEGEYMALGASLWIRGHAGYYQNGTAAENIASDLPMVWGIQSHVKPCGLSRDSEGIEQAREAVKHWAREFKYMEGSKLPSHEERERVARWIAKGYKRAQTRYRGIPSYKLAYDVFKPIEDAAEKALKYAEAGMVLTVCVDVSHCKVRVSCDYPNEGSDDAY
mgnify:CR=1 FL=1